MPQSLIVKLIPQASVAPHHLQGYSVQRLFFSLVDLVDPELSDVLRWDRNNRGYTLSVVQPESPQAAADPQQAEAKRKNQSLSASQSQDSSLLSRQHLVYQHQSAIAPKNPCWLRVTLLDDDLFEHLIFLWGQIRDEPLFLGPAAVQVVSISENLPGMDWASQCHYSDLYHYASPFERSIDLEFITPTAFSNGNKLTPMPSTEAIFQHLRRYWNRYSGLAFAPNLVSNIDPVDFDIRTKPVYNHLQNAQQTLVGCIGRIKFQIGDDEDPLTIKRINTLSDFSRYCGIGVNAQVGMGVVRRREPMQMVSSASDAV